MTAPDNPDEQKRYPARPLYYIILGGSLLIGCGLALGLGLGLRSMNQKQPVTTSVVTTSSPSVTIEHSNWGRYRFAAVAADSGVCSTIGTDILAKKGGSAVDSAIATLVCLGIVHRHNAGIGGGFFMTVYNRTSRTAEVLNARERAPLAANATMFVNRTDGLTSLLGGLAVGVPGEIKGYWEAHQKYGRLAWRELFEPTIKICREGVAIDSAIHVAIRRYAETLKNYSHSMYFDSVTGETVKEGDIVKYIKLADTLQKIADGGQAAFYDGELSDDIVQDVRDKGGIITREDLRRYNATWRRPVSVTMRDNLTLYSMPPPGSGAVFGHMLQILDGYNFKPDDLSTNGKSVLTYHRIIEAMKFAYAKRSSLGDADFVDVTEIVKNMTSREYGDYIRSQIEDEKTHDTDYYGPTFYDQPEAGTTHISVIDAHGNTVAATSTINTYFGSKINGARTGIAFNNEMDDFSTPGTINNYGVPASAANFIVPDKRPLSSMTPSIIINNGTGDVVFVAGGSGGTRITTSTALVSLFVLRLGLSVGEAVDHKRVHHQLLPKEISIERGFSQVVIDGLKAKGHNVTMINFGAAVQALNVKDGMLYAASDLRKEGKPDGY